MKLENLVGKELCNAIVEVRDSSEEYEEVVLLVEDVTSWMDILSEKLGSPLITANEYEIVSSSEDVKASKIDLALESAKSFGGIIQGQTLYHSVYDSTVILIMICPWQDNVKVTLKKVVL